MTLARVITRAATQLSEGFVGNLDQAVLGRALRSSSIASRLKARCQGGRQMPSAAIDIGMLCGS
jgi:hypothetical protein